MAHRENRIKRREHSPGTRVLARRIQARKLGIRNMPIHHLGLKKA